MKRKQVEHDRQPAVQSLVSCAELGREVHTAGLLKEMPWPNVVSVKYCLKYRVSFIEFFRVSVSAEVSLTLSTKPTMFGSEGEIITPCLVIWLLPSRRKNSGNHSLDFGWNHTCCTAHAARKSLTAWKFRLVAVLTQFLFSCGNSGCRSAMFSSWLGPCTAFCSGWTAGMQKLKKLLVCCACWLDYFSVPERALKGTLAPMYILSHSHAIWKKVMLIDFVIPCINFNLIVFS